MHLVHAALERNINIAMDKCKPPLTQSWQLYGRRQSRPLRKHKQQLMATLLPRFRMTLSDPFSFPQKSVWLEIGFGGGEHLTTLAQQNPEVSFLGCEPFVNGVASLLKTIESLALSNIRITQEDARTVMEWLPTTAIE